MSKIEVNEIVPQSGTTLTLGGSGDTLSIASGVTSSFPSLTVSGDLTVDTSTLYVDSTNNRVGIGTASPSQELHIVSTQPSILLEDSDNNGQALIDVSGGNINISADPTGAVASSNIDFLVDNSQAMRIDSSGNVLVGTTASTDPATNNVVGIRLSDTGRVSASATSTQALNLNRTTDDGDIAIFRKDSATVGSIGAFGGDVTIGNNDVGIVFGDGGNGLFPYSPTDGNYKDNHISLGNESYRWRHLYLSASLRVGGTGTANALDDYEEGTFTPTYLGSTSNPSVTYDTTVRYGAYTKIGRIVYFNLVNRTDAVSSSGSGDLRVGGLPFNADNSAFSSVSRYGCNIGGFTGFSTSGSNMTGYIINDYIELFETQGASTVSTTELVDGGNRNEIQITGFYVTSS